MKTLLGFYTNLNTLTKIMALVGLMSIFMISVAITGYYFNDKANESIDVIYNHNLQPIRWINLFRIHTNANNANVLAVILDDNQADKQLYIDDINNRAKESTELLAEFKASMQSLNNTYALEELGKLENNIEKYRVERQKMLDLALKGEEAKAFALYDENTPLAKDVFTNVSNLADNIQERAEKRMLQAENDKEFSKNINISVILTALLLSVVIGFFLAKEIQNLIHEISDRMQEVADGNLKVENFQNVGKNDLGQLCGAFNGMNSMLRKLDGLVKQTAQAVVDIANGSNEMKFSAAENATASQQIATTINQLASGSQEQSTNIGLSVDNINEINDAIKQIFENAKESYTISTGVKSNAGEGVELSQSTLNQINEIKSKSAEVATTINELGELSNNIEEIVELIKSIAGQTNLLALNAAIEAARAGEHGKGFAVVADEVKSLATDCANATDKITDMIKQVQNKTSTAVKTMTDSVNAVDEGVKMVENTGHKLKEIAQHSETSCKQSEFISEKVDSLSESSESLLKMMENISAIVEQSAASSQEISGISEEQSANLEQITHSAENLAEIVESLNRELAAFKL